MTNNPHVKIEVSGHTDNTGDAAANLKLSQLRSQSVINELLKKGIDKKRLASKGYGQLQPVAPNTLPNGAPNQDGMQANRRVELLITSVN